ncbi:hypothetical protein [Micromonospora sp. NPDC047730]|uniref:hypothetical protein n=1 Tax=Micromonospora sp. NPDC047730 TaxID=3364253 RepID=UPI0037114104
MIDLKPNREYGEGGWVSLESVMEQFSTDQCEFDASSWPWRCERGQHVASCANRRREEPGA